MSSSKETAKSPLSQCMHNSDSENGGDINYLEFFGVSSNNRVNGFALSGEVLVISGDDGTKK